MSRRSVIVPSSLGSNRGAVRAFVEYTLEKNWHRETTVVACRFLGKRNPLDADMTLMLPLPLSTTAAAGGEHCLFQRKIEDQNDHTRARRASVAITGSDPSDIVRLF